MPNPTLIMCHIPLKKKNSEQQLLKLKAQPCFTVKQSTHYYQKNISYTCIFIHFHSVVDHL